MENPSHIFISYSSKDRSLVEKIHPTKAVFALEAAGFNVWREQTRLETHTGVAGRPRKIAFALVDGDVVCLMLSQHAAASKWLVYSVGCSTSISRIKAGKFGSSKLNMVAGMR